ncbi:MAG TPA: HPr family phosphocarrier protein [Candidatus Butyricicoccus avistercoris]|uniref:HPr family phosphocarrier protein n=1 Tax=Candidatus Butyricicoccus avistercoris TaxID=2838518 RepID=A0A9D1PIQ3_9FIRM|nr:HPr family phosphocarrier protein [Candidatus Butyricicoccus avistercoris]
MKNISISLKEVNDITNFVNLLTTYDYEVDLVSGRYIVNAKSLLGIYSLDLSKPVKLVIYSDECDELLAKLKEQFEIK